MSSGTIDATGNFPSATGLQLEGSLLLGQHQMRRSLVTFGLTGTLGSSPVGKLQTLMRDGDASTWVDVKNASLSAVGQKSAEVVGEAVRLNVDAGSGYTTLEASYNINVYPIDEAHHERL